jgi:hypothetical protein
MSGAPSLRRTQEIFWRLITAPKGVHAGLQEQSASGDPGAGEFDALFRGGDGRDQGGLPAAERLDIYANMYFYRLLDALKEDYPRLLEAIGAGRFHNLITDYLLRHPSKHPSLRFLGEALPDFAAAHPLAKEYPWLHDLARLEWDRVEVFDAPDAAALGRDDLARLPQERAGEAHFALIPACRVRCYDFDVARLWRELKERPAASPSQESGPPQSCETALPPVVHRSTWLRIWRQSFVVYHRSIEEDEAGALQSLRGGAPLETVCQQLAAGMSMEKATARIGLLMQGWLEDGLLASFKPPPP